MEKKDRKNTPEQRKHRFVRQTDDAESVAGATRAYWRRCARHGLIYHQPNRGLSSVVGGTVILRNINGTLARYAKTGRGLRFAEPRKGKGEQ